MDTKSEKTDSVTVVENVKSEELDLDESVKEVKETDEIEEKTEVKTETVVIKEEETDLTSTDSDKLSGGVKVFREALNTFASNPDEDVTVFHVMDKCKTVTCYVGIDEAGRGPVLGRYCLIDATC